MKEKKKKKKTLFSDMPVALKFFIIGLMCLLAVTMVFVAMLRSLFTAQEEKDRLVENTVITASEQIMDMAVDSAVAIAKNIYSNETIYTFLNTRYASSSEYYEAYYSLQQNTAMRIADTNVVKGCTIYTENPTVLTGGNMKQLDSAKNEYWYKCSEKLNKSTVLCVDPDKLTLILVRKLDYISLDTGKGYLCLELNKNALVENYRSLGFDGDLYLMSGGALIYGSSEISDAEDVLITTDFDCITKNYYSADIEYYVRANKKGFKDFILVNKFILAVLFILIIAIVAVGVLMCRSIRRRIRAAEEDFNKTGSTSSLSKESNGKDEIGTLLDICCSMSERLVLKGSEYQLSSDILQQKSSDYDSLFSTAMRLDAELALMNSHPELGHDMSEENIPLSKEIGILEKLADKEEVFISGNTGGAGNALVPAYSIVLIADDIIKTYRASSIELSCDNDTALISFYSDTVPKSSETLRLHAIFEEDSVSNDYAFDRNNRYNPYLRFRHCLGADGDAEISEKEKLTITLKIRYKKEV